MTRHTDFPQDTALSITEGATVYSGMATAVQIAGQDVIILARSLSHLDVVHNKLNPKGTLQGRLCKKIAIVQASDIVLDDEL